MATMTDSISYEATIALEYTEQYFQDDDGALSIVGETILERLADELPDFIAVDLDFDTDDGNLAGLSYQVSIDHIAFTEMEKLLEGLSLDWGHELQTVKTIYATLRAALAFYTTPDGLAKVHADKVADMASHDDLRADAIHEEIRMNQHEY